MTFPVMSTRLEPPALAPTRLPCSCVGKTTCPACRQWHGALPPAERPPAPVARRQLGLEAATARLAAHQQAKPPEGSPALPAWRKRRDQWRQQVLRCRRRLAARGEL